VLGFPADPAVADCDGQSLLGRDLLVALVYVADARTRRVLLPAGARWTCAWTGAVHVGGQVIDADAPLAGIPLFLRDDTRLPIVG
jgi:alpha-D-xyloside xylohydrolase